MRRPEQRTPPADPVSVERVGALSWRPVLVAIVIGAVVVGALALRPWQTLLPTYPSPSIRAAIAPASPLAASMEPTPAATAALDPQIAAATSRMLCNAPPGWRLVSTETGPLGDTRTMYGAEPVKASGPSDPAIPTVDLYASRLFGVGVCRPNPGALRIADLPFNPVVIWSLGTGEPQPAAEIEVIDSGLYRLGEAYFRPPGPAPGDPLAGRTTTSWPAGKYVLEIDGANPDGSALWIALDFALTAA
jgi:hypothetical protein